MSDSGVSGARPATTLFPFHEGADDVLVSLDSVPNPKPTAQDKKSYGRLSSLYTAFSTDFAEHVLELCVAGGRSKVFDPFSGMGTLGEAARTMPVRLTLNDINPFATLSSLFRTSPVDELLQAIEQTRDIDVSNAAISEKINFLAAIRSQVGEGSTVLDLIRDASSGQRRVEAHIVHLLSLVRMATHRRLRGSNPTWTKRSKDGPIDAETMQVAMDAVLDHAELYVRGLPTLAPDFSSDCRCGNVIDLKVDAGMFDAVITSPPYPNRTDYIRHYLPAAELLLDGSEEAERGIREAQIGTPLIRTNVPTVPLPDSVVQIIEAVRLHGSYASERYYAKGFLYYFTDMQIALRKFASLLREGGVAMLVVQDAHYKELRIPVADLLIDVASECGFVLQSRKDFRVQQTLARLSPHSRASASDRRSFETAFVLKKISR